MGRDKSPTAGFTRTPEGKGKNMITSCKYLGGACTCTNLNGPGCKKKQSNNDCLTKKQNR